MPHDVPRTLKSEDVRKERRSMLFNEHVVGLTKYVEVLGAKYPGWEFPYFDPLDGGRAADMLFPQEKPGPMTSPTRGGSGFISRDNDDRTAEAAFNFMRQADIPRNRTVRWNVIPGWNGTTKTTAAELQVGIAELNNLLTLLPNVRVAVLVGNKAHNAQSFMRSRGGHVFMSAHPGPQVYGPNREMWDAIPRVWKEAYEKAEEIRQGQHAQ